MQSPPLSDRTATARNLQCHHLNPARRFMAARSSPCLLLSLAPGFPNATVRTPARNSTRIALPMQATHETMLPAHLRDLRSLRAPLAAITPSQTRTRVSTAATHRRGPRARMIKVWQTKCRAWALMRGPQPDMILLNLARKPPYPSVRFVTTLKATRPLSVTTLRNTSLESEVFYSCYFAYSSRSNARSWLSSTIIRFYDWTVTGGPVYFTSDLHCHIPLLQIHFIYSQSMRIYFSPYSPPTLFTYLRIRSLPRRVSFGTTRRFFTIASLCNLYSAGTYTLDSQSSILEALFSPSRSCSNAKPTLR